MTHLFAKAVFGTTLVLLFAPQEPTKHVSSVERHAARSNPLRASFGKATHVVVAKVTDAAVYTRSGERLDELPNVLGRRQYPSLALHVEQTLDSAGVKVPPSIDVRLEAAGLQVYPFILGLTDKAKIFFLKMNLGYPAKYYYPGDLDHLLHVLG